MQVARSISTARLAAGLTIRGLATRADTSHATISAYESGRKTPRADTWMRVLRAAGVEPALVVTPRPDGGDRAARWRELRDALQLAEAFPARPRSRHLRYPVFGRSA